MFSQLKSLIQRQPFLWLGIFLSALLFLGSAGVSIVHIVQDTQNRDAYLSDSERGNNHYIAVFPSMEGEFFTRMWNGLEREAEKRKVAVELQVPKDRLDLKSGMVELLDIARISRVDGLLLYVTHEAELRPYINRLSISGIPVVTLESDAPKSRRASFVGSNSFRMGQRIGTLMQEGNGGEVKAAMIQSQYYSEKTTQWSIINYGILTSLSSRDGDEILTTVNSESGVLSGEELTREILFLYPEVNTIFCTSPVDTIAAYRTVNEFSDKDVRIIGYGYNEEIRRGLESGAIYATLVRNPEEIGARAVETLEQLSQNRYVSSFIYIPSEVQRREGQ